MTAAPALPAGATRAHEGLLLRVGGLTKSFGATQALRDASFELRHGEVHALVGENGCGKSTFVKILSGVHTPDAGTIELGGVGMDTIRGPRAALRNGIVTVFQEVLVSGARSVLDNVWLGSESPWRSRVGKAEKRERADALIRRLRGAPLPLDEPVEALSLSDRQACGIVRALLRDPRLLILDEATSALDVDTRDRLFAIVAELIARDVGVIFITHRLDEIAEIGDRITVMRSGRTVASLQRDRWTSDELIRHMTGEDVSERRARARRTAAHDPAQTVVRVEDLRLHPGGAPMSTDIRAGEVVGVAGLEGQGQERFLHSLRGAGTVAGSILRVDGDRRVAIRSPAGAAKAGIFYVPRERGLESSFGWMSVRENFGLPTLEQDSRRGWLDTGHTASRLAYYVDRLGIVLGRSNDRITTLSGGNQQKVMIARWLAAGPRLLILNDPTRGIDIGAKHDLYELVTALAEEGLAVVMLSTEVDEYVELMDRVLVFREHELFRELGRAELSREALVAGFFGEEAPHG